jgi:hypothetical protein
MSDWVYLRMTIDLAIHVDGEDDEVQDLVSALKKEDASNGELESAIKRGWAEIDGYSDVEEH